MRHTTSLTRILTIAAASMLSLSSAACAQTDVAGQSGNQAQADEPMVPMTRPERPKPQTFANGAAVPSRPAITDWSGFLEYPSTKEVEKYAMSPPVSQGEAIITVMKAPAGFDRAAYVETPDSIGVYLINNIAARDEALARAKQIEDSLKDSIDLDRQNVPSNGEIEASTFIPSKAAKLKLVNLIVAEDMATGNTVTLAFSYDK